MADEVPAADPVSPSEGWGVLHLFYRVERDAEPGGAKRVVDALTAFGADGEHQAITFAVLGHKADLGVLALGPDLARLHALQAELASAPLAPAWSYVSLTELSEYGVTETDERERLEVEEGVTDPTQELDTRLAAWRARIAKYREHRLHPHLPARRLVCFYPMSKRRTADANWFELDFEARKRLMAGHARVGRTYAGRVLQLITGSTGLDDWEWGVTLFSDDAAALKAIVYEMRFDEVSARYAEFGPFVTGLVLSHRDALRRVGLT